ncbi:metal ABC transporter permease [Halobacteriovorax marinus]|uniref:metal ABC transporter permease n=1 Tax=Halobacteriovorax marinus TaxID=97084 RepID=UPI003A93501F
MIEMLLFYKLSFITSILSSASFSIIGKHFIWRNKFLELFTLCQFAIIGNLVGHLLIPFIHLEVTPLITSIAFFVLGKTLFDILRINSKDRSTRMITIYLVLNSIQFLMISLFPNLETHLNNGLFGSMVTAFDYENMWMISIYGLLLILLFFYNKVISKNSLEISFFQRNKKKTKDEYFLLIPVIIGVFGLGLIYTLSFLSLGAIILANGFSNQRINTFCTAVISIFASVGGLFLSIYFENLSTTPTQVVLLALLCGLVKLSRTKLL